MWEELTDDDLATEILKQFKKDKREKMILSIGSERLATMVSEKGAK